MKTLDRDGRVIWLNEKASRLGPALTDHNGELDVPVKTCVGCVHFGIHDWHYYYCSDQHAQNQDDPLNGWAYPWPGAGKQFSRWPDAAGCQQEKE